MEAVRIVNSPGPGFMVWIATGLAGLVGMHAGAQAPEPANLSAPLAIVMVGNKPGLTISPTFMGFSHEWDFAGMVGDSHTGVNSVYRQLLFNLTAYGSGPLNLRIGGDSTDATQEPTSVTALPWAEVAKATGAHFELGVNLGSNDLKLAVNQARAYVKQMPAGSLDAIEIGNEPDHYHKNGKRTPAYTDKDFLSEFDMWQQSIMPVLPPGLKLMGPAWGGPYNLTRAESFEIPESNVLAIFSWHYYARGPKPPPPDDYLLDPSVATEGPSKVAASVAMVHAHGNKIRMGELNSIWDAGAPGISDTFQSALWAVDTMFEYAKVGIDGVNWISTSRNYYSSFAFTRSKSNGMTVYGLDAVHPIYYGLLFFQAATGRGPKLLPVDLKTQANLKAWATIDSSGSPHLVLINKDLSQTGAVEVTMPGYHQATVLRLLAPSYKSTNGVTFAGYTFDGSSDGRLRKAKDARSNETLTSSNGVFQVSMPITSAAVLLFTK